VGLLSAHEIDVPHRAANAARQRRRPNEAGRPVSQEIDRSHRRDVLDPRELADRVRCRPLIARLIKVDASSACPQINEVCCARSVYVRQTDTALVKLIPKIEPRSVVHCYLWAKIGISEIGPVTDLAVADTHEVGQSVAGHVGQVDGLGAVRENELGAFFFVECLRYPLGGRKPPLGKAPVPGQNLGLCNQDVGMAVAVEVDKPQVGIVPGDVWQ